MKKLRNAVFFRPRRKCKTEASMKERERENRKVGEGEEEREGERRRERWRGKETREIISHAYHCSCANNNNPLVWFLVAEQDERNATSFVNILLIFQEQGWEKFAVIPQSTLNR